MILYKLSQICRQNPLNHSAFDTRRRRFHSEVGYGSRDRAEMDRQTWIDLWFENGPTILK